MVVRMLTAVALVMGIQSAQASDCVVLITAYGASLDGHGYPHILQDASAHDTVVECNSALERSWNIALDYFTENGMGPLESYAVACALIDGCSPSDAEKVKPDSRTLFRFNLKNLRP